jgi:hypothetical protein
VESTRGNNFGRTQTVLCVTLLVKEMRILISS